MSKTDEQTAVVVVNPLQKVINDSGLEQSKAQVILQQFSDYFEIAAKWEKTAATLIVNDASQTAEMKMAREGRLFLKEKRVAVEHTRKKLKETALREGQTIDAIAKVLTNLILPIEEDLQNKERFAEIQEAKRLQSVFETRKALLGQYSDFMPAGLAEMTDEGFDIILTGARLRKQEAENAAAKAEAERIEREKAEAEEREKTRVENERLRAELAESNRKIAAENAAKEKEAREKAAAEKKAKEATDKEKVKAYAVKVQTLIDDFPEVTGADALKAADGIKTYLVKLKKYIEDVAETF